MSVPSSREANIPELQARIALLQLCNKTPSPPTEHLPHDIAINSSSRILPFIKEKELVKTLAFLASTTDDPGRVVAVCVEEGRDGRSMTIKLAINNGGLVDVVKGFKKMGEILQRIAQKDDIADISESNLLREAVRLNQCRVLCRLKSKHAVLKCRNGKAKMEKPKVIPTLAQAIAAFGSSTIGELPSEEGQQLKENVGEMKRLFERLEILTKADATSEQGMRILSDIILAAHRLYRSNALHPLLNLCRFEDEQKSAIRRTIDKLSRYSTASAFLFEAASRFYIFRNITVQVVKLPPKPMLRVDEPALYVNGVVSGLFSQQQAQHAISRFRDRLKKKKVNHNKFCELVFSTKYVVHAEMQLLFHYELHACTFPPRVICSGKMACFLCSLFLKQHGKFYIPSTHGRVYEKWILPKCLGDLQGAIADQMLPIVSKFNAALEEVLKREILTPSKTIPQPNESHIF
ncbi:hypothetical protein ONS95_006882 [Cadophora gregata]|uniref:uncharacterized protein n=1 Tax=Cadophora gregata TaxID=51156 RepID=UPI0026DB7407|nr:uncharacterized protein ONS95_006882 [Cadophora gregata]KAK0101727.1 hypothetical protein ONS95_006882 [Cadophora gregata]